MHPLLRLMDTFGGESTVRGKQFERLCKWILETDPRYTSIYKKVWYFTDLEGCWGPDNGIDLIAEDIEGKIWAIQAKCYSAQNSVTKHDIDSFLSESSNEKIHGP